MGDLTQLEGMLDNRGRKDMKMPSFKSNTPKESSNKESRRDRLEDQAKERFQFSDQEWDEQTKRGQRNLRQAERYEQGRGARYNIDQAYYGAKNAVDNVKDSYGKVKSLVDKIKNPSFKRMGGVSDPNLAMGNQAGIMGNVIQGPNTSWSTMQSFNAPPPAAPANVQAYNNNPMNNMTVEPMGNDLSNCTEEQKRDTTSKCYQAGQQNQYVGVERQRKTARNFDGEAGVNAFNSVANYGLGMFERAKNAPIENNMLLDKFDPMANVMASNQTDKGDWGDIGSKTGMFRYDEMGADRNSRATFGNYANSNAAQYGGYMQDGGYMDDEEVYMTPEELEQFLAAGGQVEYL